MVYVVRVNVAVGFMSFGLMSPSTLCRSQPSAVLVYFVRVNALRLNVAVVRVKMSSAYFRSG